MKDVIICRANDSSPRKAELEAAKTCEFCATFDFSKARAYGDKHGSKIELAICNTSFTKEEQFNFCPVCGKLLK